MFRIYYLQSKKINKKKLIIKLAQGLRELKMGNWLVLELCYDPADYGLPLNGRSFLPQRKGFYYYHIEEIAHQIF